MDGFQRSDGTSRGKGLGMVAIEYANAQENVVLELQIATNNVSAFTIDAYDRSFDPAIWTTVADFDFSAMTASQRKSGILNCYVGRHDVTGAMRILMSKNVVQSVANETNPERFGDVTITRIVCRDEPPIDIHSWWGFNMRTVGGDNDFEKKMLLSDFGTWAGAAGLSLALNNSVDANYNISKIDVSDRESYIQHKPFVQTPTFTSNVVGEISFKARKYAAGDPHATVTLYGSRNVSETDDGTWHRIDGAVFSVTNDWYETYSYKTDPSQPYKAFRLAVAGVEGVVEGASGGGNVLPNGAYDPPPRVLLDEMFVREAIRARMGFRSVGCFKSDIAGTEEVLNVPSALEQPHCNEVWGVQCEVYGAQMVDDIDFSITPQVMLHWFNGASPWGYENWKDLDGCHSAWLSLASGVADGRYIYRTSQSVSPGSVVPMSTSSPSCVQYMLEVVYYPKGSTAPVTNVLSSTDWMIPEWYSVLEPDIQQGISSGAFAAFNVIDDDAPPSATATQTTPVPVPYAELESRFASYLSRANGDYEAAANLNGLNGCTIWQSYLAGLVPDDEESRFLAKIVIVDGKPVVTWEPDTPELRTTRVYKKFGKKHIGDPNEQWSLVEDGNEGEYRFFKVSVEMP